MDGLDKSLNRLPLLIIGILAIVWLGYGYYGWLNSPTSELGLKKGQLKSAQINLEASKQKLKDAQEFAERFELLKARVKDLTLKLDETKGMLSEQIDVANFIRILNLEAKKIGITIKQIKPNAEVPREYYTEVPFTVSLRGAYIQMLVLFDRIARLKEITRVGDFTFKPTGSNVTKYIELNGDVTISAFKYRGTAADEVKNKEEIKSVPEAKEAAPVPQKEPAKSPTKTGGA